jgi:hypothetical protein
MLFKHKSTNIATIIIVSMSICFISSLFTTQLHANQLNVDAFGVTSLSKPSGPSNSLLNIEAITSSHYGVQSVTGNSILSVVDSSPFAELGPLIDIPGIKDQALAYPNPLSLSSGEGNIGYFLNANMTIELRIYDMLSNLIFQNTFNAGDDGGKKGWNTVPFTLSQFNNIELPVGVCVFLLLYEGNVISRGKIGVLR